MEHFLLLALIPPPAYLLCAPSVVFHMTSGSHHGLLLFTVLSDGYQTLIHVPMVSHGGVKRKMAKMKSSEAPSGDFLLLSE